jgi:uncharacterized protein YjiS (DUF1127 family)
MNAAPQTRPATPHPASPLARAFNWVKSRSTTARSRRSLAEVDARTLRDIGFTRRDIAVFSVTSGMR